MTAPYDPYLRRLEPELQPLDHGGGSDADFHANKKSNLHIWTAALAFFLVMLVVGVFAELHPSHSSAAPTSPAIVTITSTGFMPETLKIQAGQTVVWLNNDSHAHQIAADPYPKDTGSPAGFNDPVPLLNGQSYGFTFDSPGKYTYHDQLNPYTVKGEIIVQ